jgi:CHAT domain-containing protein/Tfp pilus assembly protein PilF
MFSARSLILLVILILTLIISANMAYAGEAKEAERLWEMGQKAYDAKRYNEALSYYQKSLSLCKDNLECKSANLNGLGRVYEALGDDVKALPYYEETLKIERQRNNRDGIATNLFNVGAIYYAKAIDFEKAYSLLDESQRLFRELKDRESLALVLHYIGKVALSLGRYERALSSFNESIKINKELNNQQAVAANLNLIGNVYSSLGQYDKPLQYYQEALEINKKLNNKQETATALRNIGDAYCDLLQFDRALSYYENALEMQKKLNLHSDMIITLNNIAGLYKDLNQYDKALSYYENALKIAREFNNTPEIAVVLNNIGNVYGTIGKSDAALSYYKQSLNLEKKLNRPIRITTVLNNFGMEYFRIGQYNQALYYLNEALKIDRKIDNPHNTALRLNNIGSVYLRQKKHKEAERVFIERKELERRITKTRLIHPGLETLYILTKRYDNALNLLSMPYRQPTWRSNKNYSMEYYTLYGHALKGKGMLKESASALLKAVSISEEMRQKVGEKESFFAGGGYIRRLTPHRLLVSVFSERAMRGEVIDEEFKPYGKDIAPAAFYFAELTKARTLLEAMAVAARKHDEPEVSRDIKIKEESVLKQLSEIEDNWEAAYKKGETVFNKLLKRKEGLDRELNSLISEIRTKYPKYAALKYPKPITAGELSLKENEVLIEFALTGDEGYVFVIRKGGTNRIHKINISESELAGKIKQFIEPLSTGRHADFSVKSAKELYNVLLSDALKDVKDTERLIIVPDGILGLLPFEALVIKEGKDFRDSLYVGDKWTITYTQSATALALTRFLKPSMAVKPFFAIGNPVYDKSDPRYIAYKQGKMQPLVIKDLKQYAYRGITVLPKSDITGDTIVWEDVVYPPLPETEDEIKAIAKLFGIKPEQPDVLLGVPATETNFRNAALKDYRYLHFATHADLPGKVQGIKEPFIILGQVENRGKDDGFLLLSEVLELKLNADMVVLSACSTGRGKMMEGEGVANFARAFQHAGARSVVVSLWEVASDPAVEYMKIFYGYLKSGKSRAEALMLSRKEIKTKYPNPFYWSVFVLYGEG